MMHRWNVTITHRITREKVHTFTWGTTRGEAVARMRLQFEQEAPGWAGWVFRVATLPETLQFTTEQVQSARDWLADCEWSDLEEGEIDDLAPLVIVRGVQRHYEGGWAQFVTNMEM